METNWGRPVARWASFSAPSIGFGARVHQEAPRDLVGRQSRQLLDQVELGHGVEEVGGLHQASGLRGDRLHQGRMTVADAGDSPARGQIHELAARHVAQYRSAPLDEGDRHPPEHRKEMGRLSRPHLFEIHDHLLLRPGASILQRSDVKAKPMQRREDEACSPAPGIPIQFAPGLWTPAPRRQVMVDTIFLEGIQIPAALGVTAAERQMRRPVTLDIEIERDLRTAGRSDRIGQTVHYKRVFEVVEDIASSHEHKLVEALGERIAEAVLGKFDIDAVTVTVRKPKPIAGVLEYAGIRIRRERPAS